MTDGREALCLTVYLGMDDRWGAEHTYVELLLRARATGIVGATVLRGITGFGPRSAPRRSGFFSLSPGAPTIVTMVDAEDRIRRLLADAGDLLAGKLVTIERVRVLRPIPAA